MRQEILSQARGRGRGQLDCKLLGFVAPAGVPVLVSSLNPTEGENSNFVGLDVNH